MICTPISFQNLLALSSKISNEKIFVFDTDLKVWNVLVSLLCCPHLLVERSPAGQGYGACQGMICMKGGVEGQGASLAEPPDNNSRGGDSRLYLLSYQRVNLGW